MSKTENLSISNSLVGSVTEQLVFFKLFKLSSCAFTTDGLLIVNFMLRMRMEACSINSTHCAPNAPCTFVWLVSYDPGSKVTDASIRLLATLFSFLSPSLI